MIPMLFKAGSTEFTATSDGCLGSILDCYSCTVTEERNGSFEVELEMPLDTALHDSIVPMNLIVCKVGNDSRGWQAFEIYKTEEKLDGTMTVNGQHISYILSNYNTTGFPSKGSRTLNEGLAYYIASDYIRPACPFSIVSDYPDDTKWTGHDAFTPVSLKQFLYEYNPEDKTQLSLAEVLGILDADILPDNYTINLNQPKTTATALASYGLNVASATHAIDVSDVVSAVLPYATYYDSSSYVNRTVYISGYTIPITDNGYGHIELLDLSDEFDTTPTAATLLTKAKAYIEANPDKYPTTVDPSIDIEYVDVD